MAQNIFLNRYLTGRGVTGADGVVTVSDHRDLVLDVWIELSAHCISVLFPHFVPDFLPISMD